MNSYNIMMTIVLVISIIISIVVRLDKSLVDKKDNKPNKSRP